MLSLGWKGQYHHKPSFQLSSGKVKQQNTSTATCEILGLLYTEVAAQPWLPQTWKENCFCDDNKDTGTDSELYLSPYGNLYQCFLDQIKILAMSIHLVESWISAGGFLQNVSISIRENMENTFITVF